MEVTVVEVKAEATVVVMEEVAMAVAVVALVVMAVMVVAKGAVEIAEDEVE